MVGERRALTCANLLNFKAKIKIETNINISDNDTLIQKTEPLGGAATKQH